MNSYTITYENFLESPETYSASSWDDAVRQIRELVVKHFNGIDKDTSFFRGALEFVLHGVWILECCYTRFYMSTPTTGGYPEKGMRITNYLKHITVEPMGDESRD
jgi:hypothetical protein